MIPKKILLIKSGFLLGAGVEALLLNAKAFTLVGEEMQDCIDLVSLIQSHNPDVVVMDNHNMTVCLDQFHQAICHFPKIRFIVLHLEENSLEIIDKQNIRIHQSTDLFTAL